MVRGSLRVLSLLVLLTEVASAKPGDSASELQDTLAGIATTATPAVVRFEVEKREARCPELEELLQRHGLNPEPDDDIVGEATGSGIIISEDGLLLSNHHVVSSAASMVAFTDDDERVGVRVIATDPRTDIAVLQLDAEGPWPALDLGDSDNVRVGDLVVAIGNPFDFASTVTTGIVSAKGRRGLAPREIQDYIQTDAAVNPGSSGGPLLDLNGDVIGMNTAIFSPGLEQNAGISFAIPSNMIERVKQELIDSGHVRRPWMGIVAETVGEVAGDKGRRGAEIERVVPDSPAEAAGFRRGDVVVSAGGESVSSVAELRALVLSRPFGDALAVEVIRGAEPKTLSVLPAEERSIDSGPPTFPEEVLGWSGMTVADPEAEVRSHFGVAVDRGVIVLRIDRDSPAARMGMVPGDLIIELGQKPLYDLEALKEHLATDKGVQVVTVLRAGGTLLAIIPAS